MKSLLVVAILEITAAMLLCGCTQQQTATGIAVGKAIDTALYTSVQARINTMPAGSAGRVNEQAWLDSVQSNAELGLVLADVVEATAFVPTKQPGK